MIAAELRHHILATTTERRLADLRFGARYTAAMLDDGVAGVAYTYRQPGVTEPPAVGDGLLLAGATTTDVLEHLESDDGLKRSAALAVANALLNRNIGGEREADLLHFLSVGFMDKVAMVGYFAPLVAPIQKRLRELVIFERGPHGIEGVRPVEDAFAELPSCNVALIASSAFVIGDLGRLLEAAEGCREIALVGPSTPLAPAVFSPYKVTLLSGVVVDDAPAVLKTASEGGGVQAFGDRVRKVNLRP